MLTIVLSFFTWPIYGHNIYVFVFYLGHFVGLLAVKKSLQSHLKQTDSVKIIKKKREKKNLRSSLIVDHNPGNIGKFGGDHISL